MNLAPVKPSSISLDKETLLRRISHRIQRSLSLPEILQATVAEVQQFLALDRVKIYQFHPDYSGYVIAEHRAANQCLPSLYGLNFPSDDIPPHTRQLYIESRVRSVIDVQSGLIGQSRLYDPATGDLVSEEWAFRPLDPCHQEYLTTMGVRSSLVAPIFHQDSLWGLLVVHHATAHEVPMEQLQAIQLVVDQLSVAIVQATLLQQTREKADREATLHRISTLLHSLTTIELQAALEATVAAFEGSGGRLWVRSEALLGSDDLPQTTGPRLYACGTQPILPEQSLVSVMEEYSAIQRYEYPESFPLWAIEDLYQVPELRTLQAAFRQTPIRSLLIVPLTSRQRAVGYLTIFRNEFATETLWAGQCDPDERQTLPRQSFEIWRQSRTGQTRPWLESEQSFALNIVGQFASAIEQYELYHHVQALNTNLEAQVQARTDELEQKNQQQKILFNVVAKIRESLDLATIFKTTAIEVRQALNADRVCIFQFDAESNFNQGKFVSEDVLPAFLPVLGKIITDNCFGEKYAAAYHQGQIHVVDDVDQAGFEDCHLETLKELSVQSKVIVPLMNGGVLWGLLSIHQCQKPRYWKATDVKFVQQIADQLGIALEQAELLDRTTQQAQQLIKMVGELQSTQAQLIQTEKMSSLGQLVAGVAHEINNPITFIHGNLVHVNYYMQTLLEIVDLYQQRYGQTDPDIQTLIEEKDLEFVTEDLQKVLSSMQIGTQRIREIVLSLRNFSRLDQAEMKPVNIHEGIDSTLLILQHRLKSVGDRPEIQIVKQYGDLPHVECYPSQLNQVLMNILANAIDALEEMQQQQTLIEMKERPSVITISTQIVMGDRVTITIADNGLGISEAAMPKLFDPFYTTKPVGQGTGLGLAISYQIITEKHQGTLHCVSQPGEGSQFIIEIPCQQHPQSRLPTP